jgi:hypothetical protein
VQVSRVRTQVPDIHGLRVEGVYRARVVNGILTLGRRKKSYGEYAGRAAEEVLHRLLERLAEGDAVLLTGDIEEVVGGERVELRQRRVIVARLGGELVVRDAVSIVRGVRVGGGD